MNNLTRSLAAGFATIVLGASLVSCSAVNREIADAIGGGDDASATPAAETEPATPGYTYAPQATPTHETPQYSTPTAPIPQVTKHADYAKAPAGAPGSTMVMGSGSTCSTGFFAKDSAGRPFVVTAGHCGAGESSVELEGTAVTGSFTGLGKSHVDGSLASPDYTSVRISGVPRTEIGGRYRVSGTAAASDLTDGAEVCKWGPETGESCGTIKYAGATPGALEAELDSHPGDSGSPVYIRQGNHALLAGVYTGSGAFTPAYLVLQALNLTALI
jgi:hypothetical protein